MLGMNPEQLVGLIRQFLPYFSGIATALGWTWFDGLAASVLQIIGPAAAIGSLVWSLISKTHANIVSSAAAVPGVANIALNDNAAGRALAPVMPPNVNISATAPR